MALHHCPPINRTNGGWKEERAIDERGTVCGGQWSWDQAAAQQNSFPFSPALVLLRFSINLSVFKKLCNFSKNPEGSKKLWKRAEGFLENLKVLQSFCIFSKTSLSNENIDTFQKLFSKSRKVCFLGGSWILGKFRSYFVNFCNFSKSPRGWTRK